MFLTNFRSLLRNGKLHSSFFHQEYWRIFCPEFFQSSWKNHSSFFKLQILHCHLNVLRKFFICFIKNPIFFYFSLSFIFVHLVSLFLPCFLFSFLFFFSVFLSPFFPLFSSFFSFYFFSFHLPVFFCFCLLSFLSVLSFATLLYSLFLFSFFSPSNSLFFSLAFNLLSLLSFSLYPMGGLRISWLYPLQRGKKPSPKTGVQRYNTKQKYYLKKLYFLYLKSNILSFLSFFSMCILPSLSFFFFLSFFQFGSLFLFFLLPFLFSFLFFSIFSFLSL